MKKLGGFVDAEHQLCLAHGLQLSVIKVLYNLNFSKPDSCGEEPSNKDCDEYDDDENDIQFTDGLIIANDLSQEIDEIIMICNHIYPVMRKIRNVVKMFKRSPKKMISSKNIPEMNLRRKLRLFSTQRLGKIVYWLWRNDSTY